MLNNLQHFFLKFQCGRSGGGRGADKYMTVAIMGLDRIKVVLLLQSAKPSLPQPVYKHYVSVKMFTQI